MSRAPTVLLTLGRLPKALELARAFHGAGWRVLVAEPFAWHLCRVSRAVARCFVVTPPSVDAERYLDELARIVVSEDVRLVVPVSEEAMHSARVASRLPAGARVYGMPAERLLELHDKQAFAAKARAFTLDVPDTYESGDPRAAELAAAAPHVLKPVYSCSGRGVRFAPAGAPLLGVDGARTIVQRFLPGRVLTSFAICDAGRALTIVVYRAAVLSGTVAVCFERVEDEPAVERWTKEFVARAGWSGFISFDFVVTADGRAHAVECNPRATSAIHFVEPEDLVRAMLSPEDERPVRCVAQRFMQQFFPCLTETQRSLFADRGRFVNNLRHLFSSRDVAWTLRDPLPLLTMPATSWEIIRLSLATGRTFGEVATLDVGWYADVAAAGMDSAASGRVVNG